MFHMQTGFQHALFSRCIIIIGVSQALQQDICPRRLSTLTGRGVSSLARGGHVQLQRALRDLDHVLAHKAPAETLLVLAVALAQVGVVVAAQVRAHRVRQGVFGPCSILWPARSIIQGCESSISFNIEALSATLWLDAMQRLSSCPGALM